MAKFDIKKIIKQIRLYIMLLNCFVSVLTKFCSRIQIFLFHNKISVVIQLLTFILKNIEYLQKILLKEK